MSRSRSAFTLIELLLYLGLLSLIIFAATTITMAILNTQTQNLTQLEVNEVSHLILERMRQEIQNASSINQTQSIFDFHPGKLVLNMSDASKNPTVFNIKNGLLTVKQGTITEVALSTDQISIKNLTFSYHHPPATPGSVTINLTVSPSNPANRPELNLKITYESSVTVRVKN